MLFAKPTQHGAGIILYGDYYDLKSLHATVSYLYDGIPNDCGVGDFLSALAYDIRHAYQMNREIIKLGFDQSDTVEYRGVKIFWPIILFQIALLRWYTRFKPTTKEHLSDLFRLEYIVEESLSEVDLEVGRQCINWLNSFPGITNNYLFSFADEMAYKYVFQETSQKKRFKKLPEILNGLLEHSKDYKTFNDFMQSKAKEKGCSVFELTSLTDWPEFKW